MTCPLEAQLETPTHQRTQESTAGPSVVLSAQHQILHGDLGPALVLLALQPQCPLETRGYSQPMWPNGSHERVILFRVCTLLRALFLIKCNLN